MPPRKRNPQNRQKVPKNRAVEYIAAALLIGGSAEAMANILSPQVGFPVRPLLAAILIARTRPVTPANVAAIGSNHATGEVLRLENTFRAEYVYAATRRLQGLTGQARMDAIERERTYFDQHMAAARKRQITAAAVDKARNRYGDELGWYAKMDSLTSDECRAANGKNFSASRMPAIGYPGAVHPSCRCKPGRKHATSQTVYSIERKEHAA